MSNPAPDSSRSLCRAATPQFRPFQLLLPDRIDLLQLLLTVCVRSSCCSPIHCQFSDCIRFSCCSPISNCSPIASASTAAPRLHSSACSPSCTGFEFWKPVHARTQCSRTFFAEFRGNYSKLKYEGRASLAYSPTPRTSHFVTHTQIHVKILMRTVLCD